jgi:predicted MFS family arabinose efflux permease
MESKIPNDASPSYLESGLTEEEKETMSMAEEWDDSNSTLSDSASIHSIGNQTNELSPGRLMVAIPALSLALFVSFIDTTSVSTSIPSISSDLNTGTSTAWIGSSFLVANTSFQLINGRISDIFGRKNCLLLSLVLLAIGDVGCGCAQSKEMLYAFRALAGVGGGGINSLAMIITSDITTLENRGKFQGMPVSVMSTPVSHEQTVTSSRISEMSI